MRHRHDTHPVDLAVTAGPNRPDVCKIDDRIAGIVEAIRRRWPEARRSAYRAVIESKAMARSDLPGEQRHAAHSRRHGPSRATEERLAELGRRLPPPSEEARKITAADLAARLIRRLVVSLVVLFLLALGVGAAVQWLRPLPQPALEGLRTPVRVPGTAPSLPWPSTGEAALGVQGLGTFGQVRDTHPAPVAGLAGVLTAYVVLKDHPISPGGSGPTIPVTSQTISAYQAGSAAAEPEVTVAAGETLSELDALEGLLIDSGNDMATLLADWDAGTTSAFVTKMDHAAVSLGLIHTHITDPSGADPGTVSTPSDLIRLGEAAMRIPVFSQIVSLGETTLPLAGVRYNSNFDLGQDGIVGIAAGSDTATNGCFLFAAQKKVNGKTVTLYGAVLGQSGPNGPDTAAVEAGDALVRAALGAITAVVVFPVGHDVGELSAQWGASAPVMVSEPVTVLAWPGLSVPLTARLNKLTAPLATGSKVGVLQVRQGSHVITTELENTAPLSAPSAFWRLTR
jgi:D-alanyl-D-alanine carboxypeptidase (penicillin-binding protein 5/6)